MSDLVTFAREHGILIDNEPPIGMWKRYPTEDHPSSRNGAVKFMGDMAFVQNHAVMTEPILWRSSVRVDRSKIMALIKKSEDNTRQNQINAVRKATHILNNAVKTTHPYLANKGIPNTKGICLERVACHTDERRRALVWLPAN